MWATVIANLIGGCLFYAIDDKIFSGGERRCKKNGAQSKGSKGSTKYHA